MRGMEGCRAYRVEGHGHGGQVVADGEHHQGPGRPLQVQDDGAEEEEAQDDQRARHPARLEGSLGHRVLLGTRSLRMTYDLMTSHLVTNQRMALMT